MHPFSNPHFLLQELFDWFVPCFNQFLLLFPTHFDLLLVHVSGVDLGLCDFHLTHLVVASEARIDHLHQLSFLKESEEGVSEDLRLREGNLHKGAFLGVEEILTHILEFQVVGDT